MASTSGRRVVVPLTNKSGGSVAAGDVVIVDTANNDAFTTTTTGAYTGSIGVAQETIANNASGRVATAGYVALVNVNASVTRGNYGKTHTVVKQATDAGASRVTGAFCQFLTGGTTPDAMLFGLVDVTGAGGAMATDSLWDAAGDLAVGTGANTGAKLTKGSDGAMLAMGNGSVIWNAGTSFPASKATNDRYWRTDLGMGFHWDGTRWVSDTLYLDNFNHIATDLPLSTTQTVFRTTVPFAGTYSLWAETLWSAFFVTGGTALGASHKWVITILNRPTNATIATINIDSGSSDVWRQTSTSMGSTIATTEFELEAVATKTGTPGTLYFLPKLYYRVIGT